MQVIGASLQINIENSKVYDDGNEHGFGDLVIASNMLGNCSIYILYWSLAWRYFFTAYNARSKKDEHDA